MEVWAYVRNGDGETATVTGRLAIPLSKKINPIWWFGNDPEPNPPDWYLPGQAQWKRVLYWYIRNPLVNLNDYVIGVCDRNYSVTGPYPVMVPDWLYVNDPAVTRRTGFKYSIIKTGIPRPFISYTGTKLYSGKRVLWHIGWGPGGSLMAKFNLTKDLPL